MMPGPDGAESTPSTHPAWGAKCQYSRISKPNCKGGTPLDRAKRHKRVEMIEILEAHAAH
jgi:hypothetical protein